MRWRSGLLAIRYAMRQRSAPMSAGAQDLPSHVSDVVLMGRVAERGTDRFGPDLTEPRMMFGTEPGGGPELADHVTSTDRARHRHERLHAAELQFLADLAVDEAVRPVRSTGSDRLLR